MDLNANHIGLGILGGVSRPSPKKELKAPVALGTFKYLMPWHFPTG
jgi:hypothetical protein